ncbi:MAG: hypothetical protein FWD57_04540, partial [Polyangiaceae bacterium]|nr:hypothetical protein [Polyangiaceae bacterium]
MIRERVCDGSVVFVGLGLADSADLRPVAPSMQTRSVRESARSVQMNVAMKKHRWSPQIGVFAFALGLTLLFLTGFALADEGGDGEATQGEEGSVDYADTDPSAVYVFDEVLSPHGTWVEDSPYGLVWVPNSRVVGVDFVPYLTAGYWGATSEGDWVWVSDYEWGWAVFHYGRWVQVPGIGWAWIPGRRYAPAWVVWVVGEPGYDYIGWAPMPPSYYWYRGVAVSLWVIPPPYYVYCESRYVYSRHVHHHRLHGHRAHEAARHSHRHGSGKGSHGGSHGSSQSGSNNDNRHAARPEPGPSPDQARIPAETVPRTPAKPHPKVVADAQKMQRSA